MNPQINVTEFVRGLVLHDIGKPFALESRRHTNLGYWLLKLADLASEALVALTHGMGKNDAFKEYLATQTPGTALPAISLLNNPLDHLAASVYSLQPHPLETFIDKRPVWYSFQNPFTRLPAPVTDDDKRSVQFEDIGAKWEKKLWEDLTKKIEPLTGWNTVLTDKGKRDAEATPQTDAVALPGAPDALAVLRQAMSRFPERTYPPVNDTSLEKHGRLAGILGFVVYKNLEWQQQTTWLEGTITLEGNTLHRPNDPKGAVRTHLHARLVRVTFAGVQQWVEGAARVDDLLGAIVFAEQLRDRFKDALAEKLDVPELSQELTIHEGQFELFYLLPHPESELRACIQAAYRCALQQLAQTIIDNHLSRHFPELNVYRDLLEQELAALSYGLRILPVEAPRDNRFEHFSVRYGHLLLQAYVDSHDYAPIADVVPTAAVTEPLAAGDTCDVCGIHPIWSPPKNLNDADKTEWLRKRNFMAHIFRGEHEQICLACAARRTLAFGTITKRLEAIVPPMFQSGARRGSWQAVQPESGPALPPFLTPFVDLGSQSRQSPVLDPATRMIDAGACFVRYRRTGDGIDYTHIDVFPTVSYAADANGNEVLLTLKPTARLFGAFDYQQARKACARQAEDNQDAREWKQVFADFMTIAEGAAQNEENGKKPDLATLYTVEPHLARVMERIAWIKRFYTQLEKTLLTQADAGQRPMRVLPLDVDYPTLRLLIPADRLDDALRLLDQVVTETLFSATYCKEPEKRKAAHEFLQYIVPDLLHGAVVLFKHKFPLYLALEAERALFRQLAASNRPSDASRSDGYGFRLAFSDLRGSLSEVGPLDATTTYGDLGEVLELVKNVDRPTLLQYAETRQHLSPELAQAQAVVRANRISRTQVAYVQRFKANPALFDAVYFITRAIRR